MNITVCSHYFTPEVGAPSARIYDLARQWLALGHQVQVVTCIPNHPAGTVYPGYSRVCYMREILDGIEVHRHWTYITPNKGFLRKTLGHASYLPSALFLSGRHLSTPSVIIGTSPTLFAAMGASRLARRHRVPFIMEVRDLWPACFVELGILRNRHLIRILEKWELYLYRSAQAVVTVTDAFRRNLIERGVPSGKVASIPNGADEQFWQPGGPIDPSRQKLGLDGRFVVLYIGAHGISQALGSILETARRLKHRKEICFLFVGEGAEKEKLVKEASSSGLGNVRFCDPVEKNQVRDFYALADVCLVPLKNIQLFKTFIPSKMFEMMAMAKPIIASVQGEAAEILQESGGAIVVEPEQVEKLAEAILGLSGNPHLRASMGKSGREFVIRNYSRRALAQRYLSLIEATVENHRAGQQ